MQLRDGAHPHAHGGGRFDRESAGVRAQGSRARHDGAYVRPSYSPLEGLDSPHEVTILRDPKLAGQLLPHVHRIA